MATQCSKNNCNKKIYAKGLCLSHYQKNAREMDIEKVFKSRWFNMIGRCNNPNNDSYKKWYGFRGITVCDRWMDYSKFKEDMFGTFNQKLSLDRIDNEKEYSKKNCRWANSTTQNNNTRRNHYITSNGITKTISEWCKELGLRVGTVYQRQSVYHWDINKCFNNLLNIK